MRPLETVKARLLSLGFVSIEDLQRTYAGRQQIVNWAPSWSAEGRLSPNGVPYCIRGYHTMSLLSRHPLNRWGFRRSNYIYIEVTAEPKVQPPPFWLATWPKAA